MSIRTVTHRWPLYIRCLLPTLSINSWHQIIFILQLRSFIIILLCNCYWSTWSLSRMILKILPWRIICCRWLWIMPLVYHNNLLILFFNCLLFISNIRNIEIVMIGFIYWTCQLFTTLNWSLLLSHVTSVIAIVTRSFHCWSAVSFLYLATGFATFLFFYALGRIESFKWRWVLIS